VRLSDQLVSKSKRLPPSSFDTADYSSSSPSSSIYLRYIGHIVFDFVFSQFFNCQIGFECNILKCFQHLSCCCTIPIGKRLAATTKIVSSQLTPSATVTQARSETKPRHHIDYRRKKVGITLKHLQLRCTTLSMATCCSTRRHASTN